MLFYIPFKPESPKTRLSRVLSPSERVEFSFRMLDDVYTVVEEAGHEPVVLSTRELDGYDPGFEADHDYETRLCPKPLTPAVNSVLEEAPVGVLMSDVCIATPESVGRLIEAGAELAVAPGRSGGTNAFVSRASEFEVDYHGTSYLDHLEVARERGIGVETVDSFRLSTDVDEPDDLIEVLLHGDGRSYNYLDERFEVIENDERRVDLRRLDDGA